MTNNTNSKNLESCNSCNSCNYCYSCNYCDYCYSCDSCNSCNSCDYCYSCNSCNYCYSCNYCDYCYSCYSCDSCNSCNSCDYCYSCNSCNSCNYSSGLRMSERMIFCLGEGRYTASGEGYQKNSRIFNKDVSKEVFDKAQNGRPEFELPTAKWIDKKDMTKEEKEFKSSWETTGGYLRTLSYKDAWAEAWPKASSEFKAWVKGLPNFDADIFEEITGQRIEGTLVGQNATVEIGGKKYKAQIISEE